MIEIIKTDSTNPDFVALVVALDADLKIRDGDDHDFYNQFNGIDAIQYALVAYIDEIPIGCGAIKEFDSNTMEVKRMYTPPEFRGQGIASKILESLEKWTAELGYKNCILETGKAQPEAIALYKNKNYEIIPNYGPYAGVENNVCFHKKVK